MACFSRLRGWARLLFAYGALMCLAGLLVTASRGGAVSVCAGLAVLTLLGLGRVRMGSPEWFGRTVLLVLVLLGLAVAALAYVLPRSHLLESRFRDVTTNPDRRPAQAMGGGGGGVPTRPGVRHGRGNLPLLRPDAARPGHPDDPMRAHSDYLELLAEYGRRARRGCCCSWARTCAGAGKPADTCRCAATASRGEATPPRGTSARCRR